MGKLYAEEHECELRNKCKLCKGRMVCLAVGNEPSIESFNIFFVEECSKCSATLSTSESY